MRMSFTPEEKVVIANTIFGQTYLPAEIGDDNVAKSLTKKGVFIEHGGAYLRTPLVEISMEEHPDETQEDQGIDYISEIPGAINA